MPWFFVGLIQKYIVSKVASYAAKAVVEKLTKPRKAMKGKKTILFNVAALLAALAAHYGFSVEAEALVPILGILVPAVNVWLRKLTTTPIFKAD